jgi:para-nitrobenzyl esterase
LKPTVAALAAIPPLHLLAAGDAVTRKLPRFAERWGKLAHTLTPYSPVIDGDVLPQTPWAALERGSSRGVDLLVGHTRDEFRFFTLATGGPAAVTTDQATAALNVFAPDGADYRATYPGAGPGKLHELVNSDWLFRMPSLKLAEAHAAGGGRTWAYELCWGTGPLGATHGLDVLLTLGNLRGSPLAALLLGPDPSAEAAGLSRTMRTAWTAFATTGDPGWAGFDTGERLTRVYEAAPTTAPYPEETSRRIWENHRFEPLDLTTG